MTLERGRGVIGGAPQEGRAGRSVGWVGVGGSGRPGEKSLGFEPEFWGGRCRPAGLAPSYFPPSWSCTPLPCPLRGPSALPSKRSSRSVTDTRPLSLFCVSLVALDTHFVKQVYCLSHSWKVTMPISSVKDLKIPTMNNITLFGSAFFQNCFIIELPLLSSFFCEGRDKGLKPIKNL